MDEDDLFDGEVNEDGITHAIKRNLQNDVPESLLREIYAAAAEATHQKQLFRSFKEKLKHFGGIVAFLFAVVMYSIMGGFMFSDLESKNDIQLCKLGRSRYRSALAQGVTSMNNIRTDFTQSSDERIEAFERALENIRESFVNSTWDGTDCDSAVSNWNVFGATLWCLTVITSVGYGQIAPVTSWGRTVVIAYALFGIPLTVVTLAELGSFFAEIAKFSYHVLCCCAACRKQARKLSENDKRQILRNFFKENYSEFYCSSYKRAQEAPQNDPQRLAFHDIFGESGESSEEDMDDEDFELMSLNSLGHVPWIISIFIIAATVVCGGSIFSAMEGWGRVDSIYFAFVTVATIGFGDIYPSLHDPMSTWTQIRFSVWGLFIFLGLALMSMCLNMIQMDVGNQIGGLASYCMGKSKKKSGKNGEGEKSDSDDNDDGGNDDKYTALGGFYEQPIARPPSVPINAMMMQSQMPPPEFIMLNEYGEPVPFAPFQPFQEPETMMTPFTSGGAFDINNLDSNQFYSPNYQQFPNPFASDQQPVGDTIRTLDVGQENNYDNGISSEPAFTSNLKEDGDNLQKRDYEFTDDATQRLDSGLNRRENSDINHQTVVGSNGDKIDDNERVSAISDLKKEDNGDEMAHRDQSAKPRLSSAGLKRENSGGYQKIDDEQMENNERKSSSGRKREDSGNYQKIEDDGDEREPTPDTEGYLF